MSPYMSSVNALRFHYDNFDIAPCVVLCGRYLPEIIEFFLMHTIAVFGQGFIRFYGNSFCRGRFYASMVIALLILGDCAYVCVLLKH